CIVDGRSVTNNCDVANSVKAFEKFKLQYKPLPVRHFGTYNLRKLLIKFWTKLYTFGISTFFENHVVEIGKKLNYWQIITSDAFGRKHIINSSRIVLAVGKEGSLWLSDNLAKRFGIKSIKNRTYFGVRVETPYAKKMSNISFDPKFYVYFEDGTKMKTHCYNRRGQVLRLKYFGLPLVGGHSPFTEKNNQCSPQHTTSFAVLLSDKVNESFDFQMVLKYMKQVDKTTRGRLLVQRLCDFRKNQHTTIKKLRNNPLLSSMQDIIPGNIAALHIPFDFNRKFLDFMERLAQIDHNIFNENTLIYAPAIEWWMPKITTNKKLETEMKGLYVIGDGAGVSQGICYAGATGLIVAESILSS
ncbi:unnamed protein product, partial [marine sediment metagenome]